ncbi:MAG: PG0541 family transporter-associated protein [Gemmatimonadota bacterium]
MKMLLIVYAGANPSRIPLVLERHRVDGWTELDHAHGAGQSGRRKGTRAWPGDASLYFTAVEAERVPELADALRAERDQLPEGESLRVIVMPVDSFI